MNGSILFLLAVKGGLVHDHLFITKATNTLSDVIAKTQNSGASKIAKKYKLGFNSEIIYMDRQQLFSKSL